MNEIEQKILEEIDYKPGGSWIKRIAMLVCLVSIACLAYGAYWSHKNQLFDVFKEDLSIITQHKPQDNTLVFDSEDREIGEFFTSYYIFTPFENIPKPMIEAIIAIEDKRFYLHPGVDWRAIIRAALSLLKSGTIEQGASTITQQVVRNFLLTPERTILRKLKEMLLAFRLEHKLSKNEILEIYLNDLFLGNGAYGVGAAAKRYFDKELSELKLHEFALLAGLFQSPSAYNPIRFPEKAKKRQIQVIKALYSNKRISSKYARQLVNAPLKYAIYTPKNLEIAPHFIDYIKEQAKLLVKRPLANQGLRIYTSLNSQLQKKARESIQNNSSLLEEALLRLANPEARKAEDIEVAFLVLSRKTNEIVAMIGGKDYSKSQFNRSVQALRAPGSAFKPIVYSLALTNGHNWSDMSYVSPVSIESYRPKNDSNSYLQEATLLQAFYRSLNTITIELGQKLGIEAISEHAKAYGIQSNIKQEAGSFIGASELTMLEMANVYATIAHKGKRREIQTIRKITDRHGKVLYESKPPREQTVSSPQVAYLLQEGLRSVFKYGTAYKYHQLASHVVGKTGTSNNARDNWFCGYSDDLVAIVWVGSDDPEGFSSKISASKIALPIWADFIQSTIAFKGASSNTPPPGIVKETVNPKYGNIDPNGIAMYFLEGRKPKNAKTSFSTLQKKGTYRNFFDR